MRGEEEEGREEEEERGEGEQARLLWQRGEEVRETIRMVRCGGMEGEEGAEKEEDLSSEEVEEG